MKKIALVAIAACAMLVSSCTTTTPITATSNPVGNKCGEVKTAILFNFLGGSGNLGINAAAKKAGITKISHVDQYSKNFLIVRIVGVRVYGE